MAVKVKIPTPLQKLTNGEREVESTGTTLEDIINDLEARYPGVKERIIDETGEIRRFVNIYIDEEDVRFLDGLSSVVSDNADISIIPAVAGG